MSNNVNIADIRDSYEREGLSKAEMLNDPQAQFDKWMQEAIDVNVWQPNAMTLATATKEGRPSARIMLLKAVTDEGFVFFTNYGGQKGQELEENPYAAIVFIWPDVSRQVRVSGSVKRTTVAEADSYFATRPIDSQLGAWASPQSEVVENRLVLENALADYRQKFGEVDVPRPPQWGGYCLIPDTVEFWQGRPSRLHDRMRYLRTEDGNWLLERLAP